jgi:FixJ family two-component response regulator
MESPTTRVAVADEMPVRKALAPLLRDAELDVKTFGSGPEFLER